MAAKSTKKDEMPEVKAEKGMDTKAANKKKSKATASKRTASKGKNTKPAAKKRKKAIIVLPDLEPAGGPMDPAMLGVGGGMGAPPMRRGMGAPGLPGEMPVNPMGMQRTPPGPMGMPLAPEQLPQEPMPRPPLVPRRRY